MPYADPESKRKWFRDYYASNKERRDYNKKHAAATKKRIREWFWDYKKTLACSKCGESHPACIQFHHRNRSEKTRDVNWFSWHGSKKRLLAEIAKCDVLCANCHAKLEYELFGPMVQREDTTFAP